MAQSTAPPPRTPCATPAQSPGKSLGARAVHRLLRAPSRAGPIGTAPDSAREESGGLTGSRPSRAKWYAMPRCEACAPCQSDTHTRV